MSLLRSFHEARFHFLRGRIQHLIDNRHFNRALTEIIDLARWAQQHDVGAQTWIDLLIASTHIVAHLSDPSEYNAFLAHFELPLLGDGPRPHPSFLQALADIEPESDPLVLTEVGRWLQDARPDWASGPYLVGHFLERYLRNRPPDGHHQQQLQLAADAFQLSQHRAHNTGDILMERHARLRLGAFLITSQLHPAQGRQLLTTLDWTALSPADQLWMALAMAQSHQWADRVRAMDILLDLHRGLSLARPELGGLRELDLRLTASALFKLASIEMPDIEARRLHELTETLFLGSSRTQWSAFLAARKELSQAITLPITQIHEVFPLLDKLAMVYPRRWQSAAQRLHILASALADAYQSTPATPGPHTRNPRIPLTDCIARALVCFSPSPTPEPPTLPQRLLALQTLNEHLASLHPHLDSAAARPLAILWPRLLRAGADLEEEITTLAQHHARLGTPPSYGWWLLSAHLYQSDFPRAARIIAERALESTGPNGSDLAIYVARKSFRAAKNAGDLEALRRWVDCI